MPCSIPHTRTVSGSGRLGSCGGRLQLPTGTGNLKPAAFLFTVPDSDVIEAPVSTGHRSQAPPNHSLGGPAKATYTSPTGNDFESCSRGQRHGSSSLAVSGGSLAGRATRQRRHWAQPMAPRVWNHFQYLSLI